MPRKPNASRRDPHRGGYPPDALEPAFERLKKAAANLPEVEAHLWYGTPALKVGAKSFCRVKTPETVVLMCDMAEKEMLMAAAPGIFFETDHYKGWPSVLVRINEIGADELVQRIERAWLRVAPRRLVQDWRRCRQ